jgi:hypothetical protein
METQRTHKRPSSGPVRSALCIAAIVAALAPCASAAAGTAHAARTLSVTDTAHLRYVPAGSEGATLLEEGNAMGALPGRMRAHLKIEATFTGSFVFYVRGGSIKGHGAAKPSGSGRYESFSGALVVTGGTGRYSHAHGQAGLFGVFDRSTDALTVQTTGRLSY